MIVLTILGALSKDVVSITVNGETKTIDQFSRDIHFYIEKDKLCRIYFEQKIEKYIPWFIEVLLRIFLLPIKGVFNAITFNINRNWENDISAFKVLGYFDVCLNENTEVLFELKHGKFDKRARVFYEPTIIFSSNVVVKQSITKDYKEISKRHYDFLYNIASVTVIFLSILICLLIIAINNYLYVALVSVLIIMILFSVLVTFLVLHSFKKKERLLTLLHEQKCIDEND